LGLYNDHQVNDCFPPGGQSTFNSNGTSRPENGSFSAHARMLGFMEQQQLYNAANFSLACKSDGLGTQMNATVHIARVNTFLCPSDTPPNWTSTQPSPLNQNRAPGNNDFA
jgi:uncharacterized protein DUF1559